jgi:hypothetical protein
MHTSKTYRVAGFTFTVKADEALLGRMDNLRPFEASGDARLFDLEQAQTVPTGKHPGAGEFLCVSHRPAAAALARQIITI